MFSFFKAKNKEVVNKAPEKSHDEIVADFTRSQYRDLYPKTREELKKRILKEGCDMTHGEMAMYAPCDDPKSGGFIPCHEDCICFKSYFDYVCKCLNL